MDTPRVATRLGVIIAFVCLVAGLAYASQVRIVRLSYLDGNVRIDRNTGQGDERAVLNMPIVQGARLTAQEDGRVEVEFENGSTLRLLGPAEVIFRELELKGSGDHVTLVELRNGLAYFDVHKKGDDDFRVTVAGHTLKVRKSAHFRVDDQRGNSEVAVFNGDLELQGAGRDVDVRKNETISFYADDQGRYNLAKSIQSLGSDSWDESRSQERETYARTDQYRRSYNYYGGPYSYGTYDLFQYGNFMNVGQYGWVWRPYSYGMGWDPFDSGNWMYYPSSGWVFVSSYPWGWTPYRYGSWLWVPGYGWCWRPGGYNYWQTVPVVRNPPPTFKPPVPPSGGPGPTIHVGNKDADRLPGGGKRPPDPRKFMGRDGDLPSPTPKPTTGTGGSASTPTSPTSPTPAVRDRRPADTDDTPRRTGQPMTPRKSPAVTPAPIPAPSTPSRGTAPAPPAPAPAPPSVRPAPPAQRPEPRMERPAPPSRVDRPAPQPHFDRGASMDRGSRMSSPSPAPAPARSAPPHK